ncbi:serine hydrolase domain-containing protein [Sphingomonas oryzagri]
MKALCLVSLLMPTSLHALTSPAPSPVLPPVTAAALPPAELAGFVDGVVEDALRADHIAGAAVTVVQGGRIVLVKGYGVSALSPQRLVDPNQTLFRLASISKTFTWIAALKAVEDGRMRLDAPINDALPSALRIPAEGFSRPVTLADLMAHRGGFEDRELGRLFVDDPARLKPLDTYLATDRPRRVRAAGTLPSYSNYGVALAGAAVAHVRGQPYQTLVEDGILRPLGMSSSSFREPYPPRAGMPAPMPPALAARVSQGFHWNGARLVPQKFEYAEQFAPAASLSGTAADMGRYMLAILGRGAFDGRRIYGPAVADAIATPLPPSTPGGMAYHHGFRDYALPGGYQGIGHNGVTMAFLSNMVIVPSLDLGIFVTTNTETGRNLAERLPGLVVGHFYAPAALAPKPGDPRTAGHRGYYAGTYLTLRRPYGGLGEFAYRLGNMTTVSVGPDGTLVTAGRTGSAQWVREATTPTGVDRFVGRLGAERILFTGKAGHASHLFTATGGEVLERVPLLMSTTPLLILSVLATIGALLLLSMAWGRPAGRLGRLRLSLVGAGGAWLVALLLFQIWATAAQDSLVNTFTWPGLLPGFSIAVWLSAILAAAALIQMPGSLAGSGIGLVRRGVWVGASLLLVMEAVLLGAWGGLSFWSW